MPEAYSADLSQLERRFQEKKAAHDKVRDRYLETVDALVKATQERREATAREERPMEALNQVQNELTHAAADMGYAQAARDTASDSAAIPRGHVGAPPSTKTPPMRLDEIRRSFGFGPYEPHPTDIPPRRRR